MSVLFTHPGKIGDLLWSLATVRAYAIEKQDAVDFMTGPTCEGLVPFIEGLPYIKKATCNYEWKVEGDCPGIQPFRPPLSTCSGYDEVFHLGMREWPSPDLLTYYSNLMRKEYGHIVQLDDMPWLLVENRDWAHTDKSKPFISIAFSDEWVELKVGIITALLKAFPTQPFQLLTHRETRMFREFSFPFRNFTREVCTLPGLAGWLAQSKFLITCKSAPRVMARGLGCPTLVVEPSVPRHQAVFDPPGGRERILNGFDAREVVSLVEWMIE